MNDNDLKGKIACELIIEATETKGKRPTQLNFDELIDVVTCVVKKLTIPVVVGRSEQLKCDHQPKRYDKKHTSCKKCGKILQIKP
jgi:hypothetical protein